VYNFIKRPSFGKRHIPGFLFVIVIFLFGVVWMQIRRSRIIDSDSDVVLKGYVLANEGETSKSFKFRVRSIILKTDSFVDHSKLTGIVYLKKDSVFKGLKPGDVFYLAGKFLPYSEPLNPYAFDYSAYLERERVSFRIWSSGAEFQKTGEIIKTLSVRISLFRDELTSFFYSSGIRDENLALLKAMFLGDRSALDPVSKRNFSNAGVIHLLAVSGLHLGIVYLMISFFLVPLNDRKYRFLKSAIVLIFIWSYALFTGLAPSVFRAAVMFSMFETGSLLKRPDSPYNRLLASMLILIIIDPYSVYKAGFWLSHSAVAGIVFFYPLINNLIYFHFIPFRWLWSLISVSVSAQITTFPLSIYYFHMFPVYFIISNILLVPLLAPVLLLAFISAVSLLIPYAGNLSLLFTGPLNELTGFMLDVVRYTGELPGAVIKYISLSGYELLFMGGVFIALIMYVRGKVKKAYFVALISGILLMTSFIVNEFNYRNKESFIVYANNDTGIFNKVNSGLNILLLTDSLAGFEIDYICGGFWSTRNAEYPEIMVKDKSKPFTALFVAGNDMFVIMHNLKKIIPLNGDIAGKLNVVISGNCKILPEDFFNALKVKNVILASDVNYYYRKKIIKAAKTFKIDCYDVTKEGAFVYNTSKMIR
jgi:competence protein ComEC